MNAVSDWPSVVASAALLRASDAMSNQRALGIVFLVNCSVSSSDLVRFSTFVGRANGLIQLSTSFDKDVAAQFQETHNRTALQQYVCNMTSFIASSDFPRLCRGLTGAERTEMTTQWKDQFQTYLSQVVDDIRIKHVITGIVQVC